MKNLIHKIRSMQNGYLITNKFPILVVSYLKRIIDERIGSRYAGMFPDFESIHIRDISISRVENNNRLRELVDIYDSTFNDEYEKKHLETLYKLFRPLFFYARQNNKMIGYCVYKLVPNLSGLRIRCMKACLFSIAVLPSSRGSGVGKKLLQITLDFLKAQNVVEVYLYVHSDNESAVHLYQEFGFRVDPGKKDSLTVDRGIMYMSLNWR